MKYLGTIETNDKRNLSLSEWVILGLLVSLFISFNVAEAGTVYQYEEGECKMLKTVRGKLQVTGVGIEKCGFQAAKASHTEWDIVGGKCQKVYVYISATNPQWELRKAHSNEQHSLEDCGYDMSTPKRQAVYYEKTSNRCRKKLIYSSTKGLEDIEIVTDQPMISQKIRNFKRMDRRVAAQAMKSLCR